MAAARSTARAPCSRPAARRSPSLCSVECRGQHGRTARSTGPWEAGATGAGRASPHEDRSLIDATLLSSFSSAGTAIGIMLAFNSIGWKPSNILFNAVDALLGDPLISSAFDGAQPASTLAHIDNTTVDAADIDVSADNLAQINSTVSNAATSSLHRALRSVRQVRCTGPSSRTRSTGGVASA